MATNVAVAGLGVATGLLSARLLGPEGRGQLAAIQAWPTVLAAVAMLGLDSSVVYCTSRRRGEGSRYLASALALIGIVGIGVVAAGWALLPWLLAAQSASVVAAARVFLLMVPIYALIGMPHQMLRAVGAWRAWNVIRVLSVLGWLVALLLARFVVTEWANPTRLSALYLIAQLWLVIPVTIVARRYLPGPLEVRRQLFRPLLQYGLPDMLTLLPRTLNQRLDQLLMMAFLDARTLGLYVVAVAWSGAVTPLLSAVGPVLVPTLSASTDARGQRRHLAHALRLTGLGAGGLTLVVLILTSKTIPLLFGPDYSAAVPAALVLVVASGLNGINLTLADGLRGLGRPQSVLVSEVLGLVATGVLLIILLSRFGSLGAAIASLAAYSVVCASLTSSIRRWWLAAAVEKRT